MNQEARPWQGECSYLRGFGNQFSTEAWSGALPGQNSPQKVPDGLYSEVISGTAFTVPRSENRYTWMYRLRPSAGKPQFKPYRVEPLFTRDTSVFADRLRWSPSAVPATAHDFVDGLFPVADNGDPRSGIGTGVYLYSANRSMNRRFFMNSDGELLIVPQLGKLKLWTELGLLELTPGEFAVIPRGFHFSVDLVDSEVRGYLCENYGALLRLPELGPIGSSGLANARDFLHPAAGFEDVEAPTEIIQKGHGKLWTSTSDHSPLNVVAWRGNYAPYKFDLADFNAIGTVSFDHPDPSINTVLHSPSATPGVANVDFVVFAPRWLVAEHTFRPPWFHRNVMSEYMGLIHGTYDAKADGFLPGGASLHNPMSAHGPDFATYERAISSELTPHRMDSGLAFMFETRLPLQPTVGAIGSPDRQQDYIDVWSGFKKAGLVR